jgi:hypothetical protein
MLVRRLVLLTFLLTLACATDEPSPDIQTSESESGGDGDSIGLVCDSSSPAACESAGGLCCSDDPAALLLEDLDAQVTPQYQGGAGEGIPLFSGGNNPLSRWGMCVAAGSVPQGDALDDVNAQGCPIPCNPNWDAADVALICGPARVCCQTVELGPEDCALDPDLGDSGCWRPVTGNDVMGLGGLDSSNWSSTDHATHQDPNGTSCQQFASGLPAEVLADYGLTDQDVFVACVRRLGVADTRGMCTSADAACPFAAPSYRDACEQRNDVEGRTGCG